MTERLGLSKGHRYSLVLASVAKWVLQDSIAMPADKRLEFLDHLEKMVDGKLTADVIALVRPMDSSGQELWKEAAKLGWRGYPSGLDVLADKFEVFAALNPSLKAAHDEACRPWSNSA